MESAEIQKQIDDIKKLMSQHGSCPEVEGMIHALQWALDQTLRPSPTQYARMMYGVDEAENA